MTACTGRCAGRQQRALMRPGGGATPCTWRPTKRKPPSSSSESTRPPTCTTLAQRPLPASHTRTVPTLLPVYSCVRPEQALSLKLVEGSASERHHSSPCCHRNYHLRPVGATCHPNAPLSTQPACQTMRIVCAPTRCTLGHYFRGTYAASEDISTEEDTSVAIRYFKAIA